MKLAILSLLIALTCASPLSAQGPDPQLAEINDAAAFLAGEPLPNHSEHPLTLTASWRSHVSNFGRDFSNHQERVLFPMSDWSSTEVTPNQASGAVVRYLFSGPDIIHAFHMFPTAGTFILCGLEPVGQAPKLSTLNEENVGRALSEVRHALNENIQLSFFRTKDMKEDLKTALFPGTTPLIMTFLAKAGQYINELEFVKLNKDGTLSSLGMDHSGANGVRMVFSPRRLNQPKTLYYFSSDLSNGGFETSGFGTWIAGQEKGSSYLKAASFLMHNDWFSQVREHLLNHSYQIIEDDSGIPWRYFDSNLWDATLYGVYTGPIDLFKTEFQSDLVAAYREKSEPLPFGTGYKWRKGDSNLMRFLRKDRPAITAPAAAPEPSIDVPAIPAPAAEPSAIPPPPAPGIIVPGA